MQGKTALVTSSTSGIGLGTACSLAAQDTNIIMDDFSGVETPEAQIAAAGKNAVHIGYRGADMSKPAEIEATFAYANAGFGGVDIFINNADIQYVANVEDFPAEHWDAITAVSLTSASHTTRLAVPGTKHKNWGRTINVASVHGLVAPAQKSAYMTAKRGIVDFTKSVALEAAQTSITSNAICPGWVLMPFVQKQIDMHAEKDGLSALEAKADLLMEKQPSHEFVTPDQPGALIVLLCSDTAGQMHNVAWNMDGGWAVQ